MPEDYINMPTSTRIEIYLEPSSPDDALVLEIWEALKKTGRGRRQSFFRHIIMRGLRTLKEPDVPDVVSGIMTRERRNAIVIDGINPNLKYDRKIEMPGIDDDLYDHMGEIREPVINENITQGKNIPLPEEVFPLPDTKEEGEILSKRRKIGKLM